MPIHALTEYTHAAVNSILQQSHDHLELVLVGKDDIESLVRQLPVDNRIVGIAREQPGIIGALNTGLAHCKGEYIARMDSDDIAHCDRLQLQLQLARIHNNNALISARVDIFSDDAPVGNGNQHYQHWLNALCTNQDIRRSCLVESPLPHPSLFAHKSYWQRLEGYRDRGWPEDYDLILRTWLANIAMVKSESVLLRWREHPERLTRTDGRYARKAFIEAKAWAATQTQTQFGLDTGRAIWIAGTGRNARYWHDALLDNNAKVAGFVELDNAKVKTQKRHLPVINYSTLASERGNAFVISAISNTKAKQALLIWFKQNDMVDGVDYVFGA